MKEGRKEGRSCGMCFFNALLYLGKRRRRRRKK